MNSQPSTVNHQKNTTFSSVYGPVKSWRYGQSLGIDPIGEISTCSFNCVYCQLGEIEQKTQVRSLFIPTAKIIQDLQNFSPWNVDIITLSGSGEPTLALNLGEILQTIKDLTGKPTLVLTNGTLLTDAKVRDELLLADYVSVKLDGINAEQLKRIDRPVPEINLTEILSGIKKFSQEFPGKLGIQTMLLANWDEKTQTEYINFIQEINPSEIQLNTPTRPKPLHRQLDGRGNHSPEELRPYEVKLLKCVSEEILQKFATRIYDATSIPVRFPVSQ